MNDIFYNAFISYSTQDSDFVTALRLALELSGKQVWQDVKELELSAEWWEQIKSGILASDNFLFVVSPHSMSSPVCHLELEYARELNKRLIIVRHKTAQKDESTLAMVNRILKQPYLKLMTGGRDMLQIADDNWQSIEAEQNINIRNKEDLSSQVPHLVNAFDKDLLHIRQGNILLGRAKEWLDSDQNPSFLLVGSALYSAEEWKSSGKQPEPNPNHIKYISASRDTVNRQRRRLYASITVGIVAIIIAIVASVFSIQTQERADRITAQIIHAERELTSFPSTLTPIGGTLQASQQQITAVPPTLTQAAHIADEAQILQEIAETFASALIHLNENRINPALNSLNEMVKAYPDQGVAYLYLGIIYSMINDQENALENFNQAIEYDPNLTRAFNNRGIIYYAQGEYEKAIEDYNHAYLLDPRDTAVLVNRGLAYAEQEQYEEAIKDYNLAIEIDPDYAAAYNNIGMAHAGLGDYEQAIENYAKAIDKDGQYAEAFNNRGVAYYILDENELAITDYTRAIEHNPKYSTAYTNRGNTHFYLEQYAQAITDYSIAIEIDPENASAFFNRGVTYYFRSADEFDTPTRLEDEILAMENWLEAERLGYHLSEPIKEVIDYIEDKLSG